MEQAATNTGEQGRRHAAAWGALLGYAATLLAIARNVLLVPAYLHFISLAEYGAWLATGAALVQIVVTDFGLAGVLTQRVSALHGARDTGRLGQVISSGIAAALGLSVILTALSAIGLAIFPSMKGLSVAENARVEYCFMLAVAANAIGIVTSTSYGLVRSFQHSLVAGVAIIVADLINIAITVILLLAGAGLYSIAYGLIARSAVAAIFLLAYLFHFCRKRLGLTLTFSWQEARVLFSDSWNSFWSAIAMRLQTQSNAFFVAVIVSPQAAALYGLTVRAHETVFALLGQVNAALAPSMAHLVGSGNLSRFKQLLPRMLPAVALFVAVSMAITLSVNRLFVSLWVGPGVFAGQAVSLLMGAAVWAASIGFLAYDSLYALGKFRLIAWVYVLSAVVHVTLLVVLLRFGLWMAPLVTLATTLLWGSVFWRQLAVIIRLDGTDFRLAVADALRTGLIAVLVVGGFLRWRWPVDSWMALVLEVGGCGVVFLSAALAFSSRTRVIIFEESRMTWRALFNR